ncbi:MAG: TadE family protein [Candidatus Methylacidiphilales bacterium]|nr:TadE family protein [Candidatus Methylacidiphilales bacterium]
MEGSPCKQGHRASARSRRGQSTIEFALTVPLLVFIMLFCLEIGFFINGHVMVATAAREGARAAALGQDIPRVQSHIISIAGRLALSNSNIRIERSTDNGQTWSVMTPPVGTVQSGGASSYNAADSGDLIRVTIAVPYQQLTNFVPGLTGLPISKSVTMRREPT